jgi:hypothetical protein
MRTPRLVAARRKPMPRVAFLGVTGSPCSSGESWWKWSGGAETVGSASGSEGVSVGADADVVTLNQRAHTPGITKVLSFGTRWFDRFEPDGDAWITIQERIRPILCGVWDPVRVGFVAKDEYDGYIADLYELLRRGADESRLVTYLHDVESRIMGMPNRPEPVRIEVARMLLGLDLPEIRESQDVD